MIQFHDFVPEMLTPPGFLTMATHETMQTALDRANAWIKENGIRVINIETVVLPNIWSRYEEGSRDPALGTSGESPSQWHQVVRVWYEAS
jgi:hypothetical protein